MTEYPRQSRLAVTSQQARVAGIVLLAAGVLTVVAMAHHPTGLEPGTGSPGVSFGGFIHATMIVVLGANLWGLAIFALRQADAGWMLAGILAYGTSFAGNVMAALINGFIVPAVAARVDHSVSGDLFMLLWQSNQMAAQLGVYAASAAFIFWSLGLLRRRTPATTVLGGLGLLAALIPGVTLYTGVITLNVDGAFLAYGIQAAWTGLVGFHMLRHAS